MSQKSTYLPASTTDAVLTTSLANYRETLIDNIFDDFIMLHWLKDKGRVRNEDGGTSIVEHILYEKNDSGQWYSGWEQLNVNPQEGMRLAQFAWRQASISITINRLEQRQNAGRHRMINLLEAKMAQAEQSIRDNIAAALFASARASKAINTLAELIDSSGTIGGIARSSNAFWQATETASGSFAGQGITDMRTLYNTLGSSAGKNNPDLIMTDRAGYEYYEDVLLPQVRYQSMSMANAGFESLRFKNADITYDQYATAGVIYMLNSKHISLVMDKETDFITTPFVTPYNQDGKTALILFMGNITVNNPRRLGKLTGVTA